MTSPITDKIERVITLRAPRAKVWQALSNATSFGSWFGARDFDREFAAGVKATGKVTHAGYEHMDFVIDIQTFIPERELSWLWHPGSTDPTYDIANEPPTTVTFTLADDGSGTKVTVVETGFDALPPGRREQAFRGNEGGWDWQVGSITKYVDGAS